MKRPVAVGAVAAPAAAGGVAVASPVAAGGVAGAGVASWAKAGATASMPARAVAAKSFVMV